MSITASVGIARWPADGETIEAVLRSCDTALHRAKENGRNCFCLYDATMEEEANQRWRLENRLRRAVETMAFEIHYQPRVRAADGSLVAFEALLRWEDRRLRRLQARRVHPDRRGNRTDRSARRLGVAHGAPSSSAAGATKGCRSRSCRSTSRVASSRAISRRRSATCCTRPAWMRRCLEIEVTESAVIADADAGIAALAELRQLGVRLSLDDFGTGYSSLSYLRTLPISGVKIDRSFSTSLGEDGRDTELVASIVTMAKVLGLVRDRGGGRDGGTGRAAHRDGLRRAAGLPVRRTAAERAMPGTFSPRVRCPRARSGNRRARATDRHAFDGRALVRSRSGRPPCRARTRGGRRRSSPRPRSRAARRRAARSGRRRRGRRPRAG